MYDELNQLIRENNHELLQYVCYTYDHSGNIQSKTSHYWAGSVIEETTYTYGNAQWGDLLTNYNGTAISYDASGNPLNWRNAAILNWQGRRLNSMALDSGYIHGLDFMYNADGIRTQKSYFDHSTANMYSVSYTLDGTKILAQTYKHSTTGETYTVKFFYDANDAPIAMEYDGNYYYYRTNIQGDIEGIYNSNGTLVVSYSYDAWGNILSTTGTLASTVGEINPFRYRGYYYDTETGWYYLQSRYYDPTVGRFLNADEPMLVGATGTALSLNMFSYCENNPVNYVDSTGCVVTPANVIGAAVGFVLGAVGGYFLSRFLADELGLKGWKRTVFVVGISAIISATAAVIGYFIGPYIAKAAKSLLNSLRGLFKPKFGTQLGRLGTLTRNTKPVIKGLTDHGLKRMTERGVSKALAQKIVNTGYAVAQHGGKVLYFTKEGVVVLTSTGQIVTAYSSAYFDEAIQAIVSLFYK